MTLGGAAPEERDFVHAVYGNFPYVLGFVILLTFLLLMRAFRSIVLPLKAVLLNLVSLGTAFGVVVFIFQQGHGSDAIWGIKATRAVDHAAARAGELVVPALGASRAAGAGRRDRVTRFLPRREASAKTTDRGRSRRYLD